MALSLSLSPLGEGFTYQNRNLNFIQAGAFFPKYEIISFHYLSEWGISSNIIIHTYLLTYTHKINNVCRERSEFVHNIIVSIIIKIYIVCIIVVCTYNHIYIYINYSETPPVNFRMNAPF